MSPQAQWPSHVIKQLQALKARVDEYQEFRRRWKRHARRQNAKARTK